MYLYSLCITIFLDIYKLYKLFNCNLNNKNLNLHLNFLNIHKYHTRKTITGNNGLHLNDEFWQICANSCVIGYLLFSVLCVMFLRQMHTQKARVGHVWGMGVGGQAAYQLLLPSYQGENASRVSPVHSKLLTCCCPDYSLPEQQEVVRGTEHCHTLAYGTGPFITKIPLCSITGPKVNSQWPLAHC